MIKIYIYLALIIPGLVVIYAAILRPILSRVPKLQKFYADANGFWGIVWAYCGKSATIAVHYVLGGFGLFVALLNPLASALGDSEFKTQVTDFAQHHLDPKVAGGVLVAISVITIAARLHSIIKTDS